MALKTVLAAALIGVAGIGPAVAEPQATLAGADLSAVNAISSSLIQNLKQGKAQDAVAGFFGSNPLMSGKATDLQVLVGQIDSTIRLYGPISNCELIEEEPRGHVVVSRLYICQHEHFATRWTLLMVKSTGGWMGGNIAFDDKITLPLGS